MYLTDWRSNLRNSDFPRLSLQAVLNHAYAQCWMTKNPTRHQTNRPVSGMRPELKAADVQDVVNACQENRGSATVIRKVALSYLTVKDTGKLQYTIGVVILER